MASMEHPPVLGVLEAPGDLADSFLKFHKRVKFLGWLL